MSHSLAFVHTPFYFIPPGFAVPLWERGRRADAVGLLLWMVRADAVGLLLWMQLLYAMTRHRDLPSLEGLGVCLLLWSRLLYALTRHRDLPSLEGLGVCLSFFFIPLFIFIPPALSYSYPRPLSNGEG